MQVGLFAKKVGMTQVFDESGTIFPVTILKANLCWVSQIKKVDVEGYNAIQVAYESSNRYTTAKYKKMLSVLSWEAPNRLNCSIMGHVTKALGVRVPFLWKVKSFGEFRVENPGDFKLGQFLALEALKKSRMVCIIGKSIGKGFAGNQKRHHFSRGPMTHGSKNHRLPGSIGAGTTPGRVYPGKKMAGRLGGRNVILKNVEIFYINSQENILVVKGSIPGKKNTLLKIQALKED
jgi:large subunit ribosomal protein L3